MAGRDGGITINVCFVPSKTNILLAYRKRISFGKIVHLCKVLEGGVHTIDDDKIEQAIGHGFFERFNEILHIRVFHGGFVFVIQYFVGGLFRIIKWYLFSFCHIRAENKIFLYYL